MDALNSQCAAQSIGPANQLFGALIQTILAAQCAISPPDMWPKDYGPTALQQGNYVHHHHGDFGFLSWKMLYYDMCDNKVVRMTTQSINNRCFQYTYAILSI